MRRKPYSVVLFDEIEKAHTDVFNTLLQVLDDGRLTDAQGRTVDFRNTVIIMTSNIGSQYLLEGVTADRRDQARRSRARDERAAPCTSGPSSSTASTTSCCSSRSPRTRSSSIVELMLDDLRARLRRSAHHHRGQRGRSSRYIAEQGFDPVYGARPLRRFIAHEVETRIGRALLSGDVRDGATIRVDWREGELAVTYDNPPTASEAA